MMGYGGYGYRMMGSGWGWVMMLLVLVLIVIAVLVAVRYLNRVNHNGMRSTQNNAVDILNERYAKGEITEEEYRRKKAEIRS